MVDGALEKVSKFSHNLFEHQNKLLMDFVKTCIQHLGLDVRKVLQTNVTICRFGDLNPLWPRPNFTSTSSCYADQLNDCRNMYRSYVQVCQIVFYNGLCSYLPFYARLNHVYD